MAFELLLLRVLRVELSHGKRMILELLINGEWPINAIFHADGH